MAPEKAQKQSLSKNVTLAAAIILVMNLIAKVLGFVREMVIARVFGATMYTDAYLVAYQLPYSVQQVVGWAIVSVTVPLLTKHIVEGDRKEADHSANFFLNSTAWLMLVVSLLGVLAAPLLVQLTAPALQADTAALAVQLTRIMFPSVLFVCLGMVLTGILNANRRFGVAAFAPAFSSIIIIGVVLLFGRYQGIWGLAWGTLLSFVGFFLIQIPSLLRTGWRYQFCLPRKNKEIQTALASLVPIILGMSVNQIYYILNRFFASGLAEGSISALNYGAKLAQFPAGVFVSAIAVAIYPLLTEYAIVGDLKRFRDALEKGIGVVLLLSAPAAVGLMVLRVPIVRLLFEHGAFTAADTLAASSALFYYAGGIVAYSLILVLLRVFFAFSDVKVPVYAGLCGIAANVLVSLVLMRSMGHDGLALATTVGSTVNMLVFFFFLKKHLPEMTFGPLLVSVGKIFAASLLMGAAVALTARLLSGCGDLTVLMAGISVGVLFYLLLVVVFRMREGQWVKEMIMKKIGRNSCR